MKWPGAVWRLMSVWQGGRSLRRGGYYLCGQLRRDERGRLCLAGGKSRV